MASSSSSTCSTSEESYRYHNRSASLPLKPNPITQRIEQELKKLRKWEESSTSKAETIGIGLSGLVALYSCVDDHILTSPSTLNSLFQRRNECCVYPFLSGASKLLDIASTTREILVELRQATRAVGFALSWENLNSSNAQKDIDSYIVTRKKIIKNAKKVLLSMKQIDREFGLLKVIMDGGEELRLLMNVLKCVSIINISILESLLLFLSTPLSKPRWSIFLKSRVICDQVGGENSELSNVDVALIAMSWSHKNEVKEAYGVAKVRLEALEGGVQSIMNGLDNMSKQLTKTRASLLSIIS